MEDVVFTSIASMEDTNGYGKEGNIEELLLNVGITLSWSCCFHSLDDCLVYVI